MRRCDCSGYLVELARDADLLLAEATYVEEVPEHSQGLLTSARQAGQQARDAGAHRLVLTHLWPGTDPGAARAAATGHYLHEVEVAAAGRVFDLALVVLG